ncbi:hypothetical protein WMF30_10890 [Sorangium sp. So ce134]
MRLNINPDSVFWRAVGTVGAAVWVGAIVAKGCVNAVGEAVLDEAHHTCSALRGALERLRGAS